MRKLEPREFQCVPGNHSILEDTTEHWDGKGKASTGTLGYKSSPRAPRRNWSREVFRGRMETLWVGTAARTSQKIKGYSYKSLENTCPCPWEEPSCSPLPIPPAGGSQPGTGSPAHVLSGETGEREWEGKALKGDIYSCLMSVLGKWLRVCSLHSHLPQTPVSD